MGSQSDLLKVLQEQSNTAESRLLTSWAESNTEPWIFWESRHISTAEYLIFKILVNACLKSLREKSSVNLRYY